MGNKRAPPSTESSFRAIANSTIAQADPPSRVARVTKESPRGTTHGIRSEDDQAAESKAHLSSLRVLLVSFPELFADGFARSLAVLADRVEVLRCRPERIMDSRQDVGLVLVDLDCADRAGTDLIGALCGQSAAPLIAVTGELDDRSLTSILDAGATACLAKTCSEAQALATLRRILARGDTDIAASDSAVEARRTGLTTKGSVNQQGGRSLPYRLTRAELKVLSVLCEGLPNLAIANRLGITEGTVKVHLMKVYQKLGVRSRTQAVPIGERLDVIRDMQLRSVAEDGCLVEWLLPEIQYELRRKGEVLFEKGDPANALYYVQKGVVALRELGTEVHDGELLGEVGVFSPQQLRTSSARCTVDTHLFRLTVEQVERLYFGNPRFAYYLARVMARRLAADRLSSAE